MEDFFREGIVNEITSPGDFMKPSLTMCLAGLSLAFASVLYGQQAQIRVQANQITNTISPYLGTGACLEDVNHEVYGGIYSQMIFGENFQEPSFAIEGFQNFGTGTISVQGSAISFSPASNNTDDKLIWNGATLSQGTVSVQVLRPSNNPGIAGFILSVQKPGQGVDQFYGYEVTLNGTQLVLGRHRDNWEPIADYPCVTPTDQWVSIVVQINNDVLQISVNGNPIVTYQDQEHPLAPGLIGLRSYGGAASFRNLSYTIGATTTQVPFMATGSTYAISNLWNSIQQGSVTGTYGLATTDPFVGVQSQQIAFASGSGAIGISNASLNGWGMNFQRGKPYNGLIWVKGGNGTNLYVSAESSDGQAVYDEQRLQLNQGGWQKLKFTIVPGQSDTNGRFAIKLKAPGSITVGYVFLEPANWGLYKGLPVRKDVVDGLINQGVNVLRYGGSMVNAAQYRWKNMIGPSDRRQPYNGTWYPYSSNGWGIFDFLNMCEAAGFLGIPALNSNETAQDMADFMQYVNGPVFTKWGSQRAADGHPAPYELKYIEFGNEERVDDTYWQKFQAVAKAVWAADPKVIIVVGDFTYGQPIQDPFNFSGAASGITSLEAHQKILELARENEREVWFDVHINTDGPGADPTLVALPTYVSALGQIGNGARHKVVVFELNANNHSESRALGNAVAINAISRISDALPIVTSANCLQPDGQNDNGWDQGLLFLNPSQVWLQPPGYVTQMLAGNAESQLVYSQVQSRGDVLDVTAKRSSDSKTLVLQVVNLSEQSIPSTIALDGFKVSNPVSTAQELAGPLDTVNTAQEPDALVLREIDWPNKFTNGSTSYTFKPYSLTVLSFR
jgi:Alpha-L-arabinofuranosidase C-terminal domain/Domain of Unknown Function (DUF1080)